MHLAVSRQKIAAIEGNITRVADVMLALLMVLHMPIERILLGVLLAALLTWKHR